MQHNPRQSEYGLRFSHINYIIALNFFFLSFYCRPLGIYKTFCCFYRICPSAECLAVIYLNSWYLLFPQSCIWFRFALVWSPSAGACFVTCCLIRLSYNLCTICDRPAFQCFWDNITFLDIWPIIWGLEEKYWHHSSSSGPRYQQKKKERYLAHY